MKGTIETNESMRVSEHAEAVADKTIEMIRSGELRMDVLPNTYYVYNGELVGENYRPFCRFLRSHNGEAVIQMVAQGEGMGNAGLY